MKRTAHLFVALSIALAVVACNGGHHDGNGTTNFNGLVENLAANPSDTAEPIQINGASFTFSEDPHAFDALFQ
jgi:hypothetical protein